MSSPLLVPRTIFDFIIRNRSTITDSKPRQGQTSEARGREQSNVPDWTQTT